MHDRKHLERVLKINGVSSDATDDTIRAVLLAAHYHEREIDEALAVLHGTAAGVDTHRSDLHKLINTDQNLSPKAISELLGITVVVPSQVQATAVPQKTVLKERAMIAVLALLVCAIGLGLAMYLLDFGFFHPLVTYEVGTRP